MASVPAKQPVHQEFSKKDLPSNLFVKAVFTGYRRSRKHQKEGTALLKIQNVKCRSASKSYVGKRCAYVYATKRMCKKNGLTKKSELRCIWGRVSKAHGRTGAVRARFVRNLPGLAMGKCIRIMLYPSAI